MLKIFLEVEVPAALLLHVTRCSIFSNSSIISPGLQVSIGELHALTLVARSYALLIMLIPEEAGRDHMIACSSQLQETLQEVVMGA